MCGLFGWMTTGDPKRTNYAVLPALTRHLALLSQVRGRDALGLAFMGAEAEEPIIVKGIEKARVVLAKNAEALAPAYAPGAHWLIGHTRAATVGDGDKVENAHPFRMGKTVGAHNGHVTNHLTLDIDKGRYTLPECDSAAVIAALDQHGLKKGMASAFGTFNLSISQAPWKTVLLYREYEGGMDLAYVPDWGLILWASEESFLADALELADAPFGEGTSGHFVQMEQETFLPVGPTSFRKAELLHWGEDPTKAPSRRYSDTRQIGFHPDDDGGYPPYCHPYNADTPAQRSYRRRGRAARRGGKAVGPMHESAWGKEYQHLGLLKDCDLCRNAIRTVDWVFYKKRDRNVAIHRTVTGIYTPKGCLNCGKDGIVYVERGYYCFACHAWMCRAPEPINGTQPTIPECPQNIKDRILIVTPYPQNGAIHAL